MTASLRTERGRMDLVGRVTAENAVALRQEGESWLAAHQGQPEVQLDVAGVEAASSVLLSLLLCWRREAHRLGLILQLSGVPDELMNLSQLNGVSRWLTGPV